MGWGVGAAGKVWRRLQVIYRSWSREHAYTRSGLRKRDTVKQHEVLTLCVDATNVLRDRAIIAIFGLL